MNIEPTTAHINNNMMHGGHVPKEGNMLTPNNNNIIHQQNGTQQIQVMLPQRIHNNNNQHQQHLHHQQQQHHNQPFIFIQQAPQQNSNSLRQMAATPTSTHLPNNHGQIGGQQQQLVGGSQNGQGSRPVYIVGRPPNIMQHQNKIAFFPVPVNIQNGNGNINQGNIVQSDPIKQHLIQVNRNMMTVKQPDFITSSPSGQQQNNNNQNGINSSINNINTLNGIKLQHNGQQQQPQMGNGSMIAIKQEYIPTTSSQINQQQTIQPPQIIQLQSSGMNQSHLRSPMLTQDLGNNRSMQGTPNHIVGSPYNDLQSGGGRNQQNRLVQQQPHTVQIPATIHVPANQINLQNVMPQSNSSFTALPGSTQTITLGHLHFCQDPNDPQKWIIMNPLGNIIPTDDQNYQQQSGMNLQPTANDSNSTSSTPNATMNSTITEVSEMSLDTTHTMASSRKPSKRCACICPNCVSNGSQPRGEKPRIHVCHICQKTYGKTSHLRAHLRGHDGIKPFACDWVNCNKKFTRSDELQRHRRIHEGIKKFVCQICEKKFIRSDHLSKHVKTHGNARTNPRSKSESQELSAQVSASIDSVLNNSVNWNNN